MPRNNWKSWKRKYENAETQADSIRSRLNEAAGINQKLLSNRDTLNNRNKELQQRITHYRTQAELAAIYLNLAAEYFAALSIEASAQAFKELSVQTRRPFASE